MYRSSASDSKVNTHNKRASFTLPESSNSFGSWKTGRMIYTALSQEGKNGLKRGQGGLLVMPCGLPEAFAPFYLTGGPDLVVPFCYKDRE